MAISRFRFALLFALFLSLSIAFVPEALAHKSVVAQVIPDSDGDGPLGAASRGGYREREEFATAKPKGNGRPGQTITKALLSLRDWLRLMLDHEIADPTL